MRKKYLNALFWAFAIAPVLVAGGALFFLPDVIPTHWTRLAAGPDGYGSKYTVLFVAAVFFALALALKAVMRFVEKGMGKDAKRAERALVRYTPVVSSVVLCGVSLWLTWLMASG